MSFVGGLRHSGFVRGFPALATARRRIAHPVACDGAAVQSFARGAEGSYYDPDPRPVGYLYLPDRHGSDVNAYSDDNGSWTLAFFYAFNANLNRGFRRDAQPGVAPAAAS